MKGFGIYVKNDLLEPKHIEAMGGSPLWLYLWCLDKMTSISEEGVGTILGGKPVTWEEDFHPETGVPKRTYLRWVSELRKFGYINTKRTPNGLIITVNKAEKLWKKGSATSGISVKSEVPKVASRHAKSGISEVPKVASPYRQDSRQYKDKTRILSARADHAKTFEEFWQTYPKKELKKKARDIWQRKQLSQHLPEILDFVSKAKTTDRWRNGYIKQPTAFLNGECWNDDLAAYGTSKDSPRAAPEMIHCPGCDLDIEKRSWERHATTCKKIISPFAQSLSQKLKQ